MVMLPAAALCLIWLLMGGAKRLALRWCVLLAAGLALVAITKIAFVGWGIGIASLDFTGISGHAMRATAIMPVLLYLASTDASRRLRLGLVGIGTLFGVLIGVSRLMIHVHSPSEVIAGCLLGAGVSTAFLAVMLSEPPPFFQVPRKYALPLLLLLFWPIFIAKPAPTERWLNAVALALSGHEKPYQRGYEEALGGV